jgi:predicted DNA-binding transcriptional regulator YafY
VDPGVLSTLAAVCRDHERLRFDYTTHEGSEVVRTVEPHRLAHARGRWYLVAYDIGKDDWRTFRVDRLRPGIPTGPRFTPREPPGGDLAAYAAAKLGTATWRYRATVRVFAPARELANRLPPGIELLETTGDTCVIAVGSDTPAMLAVYIGLLDADFEVAGPPELVEQFAILSTRYAKAARIGE